MIKNSMAVKFKRNTEQRRVILEELCSVNSHPTAADVYEMVRKRLPKISLGTVYRNLELLAANNIIKKFTQSGAEARFDGETEHHFHIRCTKCGQIEDLDQSKEDLLSISYPVLDGYQILGYNFEFVGICPGCREKDR